MSVSFYETCLCQSNCWEDYPSPDFSLFDDVDQPFFFKAPCYCQSAEMVNRSIEKITGDFLMDESPEEEAVEVSGDLSPTDESPEEEAVEVSGDLFPMGESFHSLKEVNEKPHEAFMSNDSSYYSSDQESSDDIFMSDEEDSSDSWMELDSQLEEAHMEKKRTMKEIIACQYNEGTRIDNLIRACKDFAYVMDNKVPGHDDVLQIESETHLRSVVDRLMR